MEAPARDATAFLQPRSPRVAAGHFLAADTGQNPVAEAPRTSEAAAEETPTRFSGLRRLLFPAGNGEASTSGDAALNAAALNNSDRPISVRPRPIQDPVRTAAEAAAAHAAALSWLATERKYSAPRPDADGKAVELPAKKSPYCENAFDGIQTLPARPGQYRR
jgi:hypothetical protein